MASVAGAVLSRQSERLFYSSMALAMTVAVIWGFAPTFYLTPIAAGPDSYVSPGSPVRWLFLAHGLAFTAWLALYLTQTLLVAGQQLRLHRTLGQAAVVLAPLMVALGLAVAVYTGRHGFHDVPVPKAAFLTVPLFSMVFFPVFVVLGLRSRRNPQAHKRLMLLAALSIVGAGFGRIGLMHVLLPPEIAPELLLALALPVWDLATRRRLHPVTVWGWTPLALWMAAAVPLGMTPAWQALVQPITG